MNAPEITITADTGRRLVTVVYRNPLDIANSAIDIPFALWKIIGGQIAQFEGASEQQQGAARKVVGVT